MLSLNATTKPQSILPIGAGVSILPIGAGVSILPIGAGIVE